MARERERFHIRIGLNFLADPNLSANAKLFYELVRLKADGNEMIETSMRQLARELGMNRGEVDRAARDLIASGDLGVEQQRGGTGGGCTIIRILDRSTAVLPGLLTDPIRTGRVARKRATAWPGNAPRRGPEMSHERGPEMSHERGPEMSHGVARKRATAWPGNEPPVALRPATVAGSVYRSFTDTKNSSSSSVSGARAQCAPHLQSASPAAAAVKSGELREALIEAGVGEPTLSELSLTRLTASDVRRLNSDRLSRGKGVGALVMDLRSAAEAVVARQAEREATARRRAEREAAMAAAAELEQAAGAWVNEFGWDRLKVIFSELPSEIRRQLQSLMNPAAQVYLYQRREKLAALQDSGRPCPHRHDRHGLAGRGESVGRRDLERPVL